MTEIFGVHTKKLILQTHFFEFLHQRQEMGLEQLGLCLADDWLREDFGGGTEMVTDRNLLTSVVSFSFMQWLV